MKEKYIGFIIDGNECYTITSAKFKQKISGKRLEDIELLYVPKSKFRYIILNSFNKRNFEWDIEFFQWNLDLIRKYAA